MKLMWTPSAGAGLAAATMNESRYSTNCSRRWTAEGNTDIIIAATNRPDVLDSGVIATGTLDRWHVVDAPDLKGRIENLMFARNKKLTRAYVRSSYDALGLPDRLCSVDEMVQI